MFSQQVEGEVLSNPIVWGTFGVGIDQIQTKLCIFFCIFAYVTLLDHVFMKFL